MTATLNSWERRKLLTSLQQAGSLFCFLDYDGTLADIALRPELATPVAGAKEAIEGLLRLPGVHVALVSGRRASEIQRAIAIAGIYYIGVHGAEVLGPGGDCIRAVDLGSTRPWIEQVRALLLPAVKALDGVWIEDKEVAIACHTRLATADIGRRAEKLVLQVYAQLRDRGAPLDLLRGHCVLEFRPAGVDKGSAVVKLWKSVAPQAIPLYAGDDVTDEDAFRLLAPYGVTIRVGCQAASTAARYCVETPSELVRFLSELQRIRQSHTAKRA